MPLFTISAPPRTTELATANPRRAVPYFHGVLAQQEAYWKRKQREAECVVDLGAHALATALVERLEFADQYYAFGLDAEKTEALTTAAECRRAALGAVGMSLMMRAINSLAGIEYEDAIAAGRHSASLITDMYDDNHGANGDDRLHIAADATKQILGPSDAPEQWYKRGKLYVLRTTPAQPTERLAFVDQVTGFHNNYEQMVSLFPYMASA